MKNQSLGAKLRRWRDKAGLSQEEVARVLLCTPSAVQKYELGVREPSGDARDRIVRLLKKGE